MLQEEYCIVIILHKEILYYNYTSWRVIVLIVRVIVRHSSRNQFCTSEIGLFKFSIAGIAFLRVWNTMCIFLYLFPHSFLLLDCEVCYCDFYMKDDEECYGLYLKKWSELLDKYSWYTAQGWDTAAKPFSSLGFWTELLFLITLMYFLEKIFTLTRTAYKDNIFPSCS